MISEAQGMLKILAILQAQHGDTFFSSWVTGLKLELRTSSALIFNAPDRIAAQRVSQLYGIHILSAARQVWPEVNYIKIKPRPGAKTLQKNDSPAQLNMELAA